MFSLGLFLERCRAPISCKREGFYQISGRDDSPEHAVIQDDELGRTRLPQHLYRLEDLLFRVDCQEAAGHDFTCLQSIELYKIVYS